MDNRLLILAFIIPIVIALVWLGRYTSRRKVIKGRSPLSFEEIQRSMATGISLRTLGQVFDVLGEAYGIDPRLIRSNYSFKNFFDLDSWTLDAGTEKVNNWLTSQGVQKPNSQLITVLDLLLLVESGRSGAAHP
jgi:hypothetical protein